MEVVLDICARAALKLSSSQKIINMLLDAEATSVA